MTASKNSLMFHREHVSNLFIFSRTPKDLAIVQGQLFRKENKFVQYFSRRKFSLVRFNLHYTYHTTKTTVAVQLQYKYINDFSLNTIYIDILFNMHIANKVSICVCCK